MTCLVCDIPSNVIQCWLSGYNFLYFSVYCIRFFFLLYFMMDIFAGHSDPDWKPCFKNKSTSFYGFLHYRLCVGNSAIILMDLPLYVISYFSLVAFKTVLCTYYLNSNMCVGSCLNLSFFIVWGGGGCYRCCCLI